MRCAAVLAIAVLLVFPPLASAQTVAGKAKVVDGDSLEIGKHRIRLWGIDAPEFKQKCGKGKERWGCGFEATDALRRHLDGATVNCVTVEADRYGRLVAKCSTQRRSINEWMVRQGWATDYARYSKGVYASAQAKAKSARRGIWSGSFEPPEHYRHRPH